jgi:NADPH:quinone reductase
VLPGFAAGWLKPYPMPEAPTYPSFSAKAAYSAMVGSSRSRVILRPGF